MQWNWVLNNLKIFAHAHVWFVDNSRYFAHVTVTRWIQHIFNVLHRWIWYIPCPAQLVYPLLDVHILRRRCPRPSVQEVPLVEEVHDNSSDRKYLNKTTYQIQNCNRELYCEVYRSMYCRVIMPCCLCVDNDTDVTRLVGMLLVKSTVHAPVM